VNYEVKLSREAVKTLDRMDRKTEERIRRRLDELSNNPVNPRLSKPLTDIKGYVQEIGAVTMLGNLLVATNLPVCFPTMSYTHYHDGFIVIVHFINNPIFSNTNPPVALQACYFATACRSWIFSKSLYMGNDAVKLFGMKAFQISLGRLLKIDFILVHFDNLLKIRLAL